MLVGTICHAQTDTAHLQEENKKIALGFYEDLWFSNSTEKYSLYMADTYIAHDIGDRKNAVEPAIEQKDTADFFWKNGEMSGKLDFQIAEGDLAIDAVEAGVQLAAHEPALARPAARGGLLPAAGPDQLVGELVPEGLRIGRRPVVDRGVRHDRAAGEHLGRLEAPLLFHQGVEALRSTAGISRILQEKVRHLLHFVSQQGATLDLGELQRTVGFMKAIGASRQRVAVFRPLDEVLERLPGSLRNPLD